MPKPNPAEDEGLRRKVVESLKENADLAILLANGEVESKKRISKAEFLMLIFQNLNSLNLVAASHNHTVARINSLTSFAAKLEDTPGLRVYYYFNEETMDLIVESEIKSLGIVQDQIEERVEIELSIDQDSEILFDEQTSEDPDLEVDDFDDYREIDETDFYLITSQIVNRLSNISANLTEQLTSLQMMVDEVEEYEGQGGIQLDYYYDDSSGQFSYVVKRKRSMGFNIDFSEELNNYSDQE